MAELQNEFSWSQTRGEKLRTCARAYYWQYYGKWNGWRGDAPDEARRAYRLSKMSNLDLFAGSVVHEVAENVLRSARGGREPIPEEEAREDARRRLNEGWKQSRERRYLADPKAALNLFEHYYQMPIGTADVDRIREKVFRCVENLYRSEALSFLRAIPEKDWLAVEALGHFHVDGVKIYAKPDVAVRDAKSGTIFLFDWKTGKESASNDVQLAGYALYAVEEFEAEPGNIETVLVYLREGTVKSSTPDAALLDGARETIRASIADMRALLADGARNIARKEDFAMTPDRRTCRSCFFRELCFPDGLK
jgi:CRISPR/Cas system-associated exonuclease Cas4 (RecB family)